MGGELLSEGRLIRTVKLSERELGQLSSEGLLPPDFSQPLEDSEKTGAVFEHESVWFPSYPYEWIPEMLHAAGDLTLTVAQKALGGGFGIKDATPFNVLFRGIEPVFVDLLSFEVRNDKDPIWKPYAQFVRTFLLPLLAHRLWGAPLSDAFLTRRDGFEPEEIYARAGFWQRLRPPLLNLVSIPAWLSRKTGNATAVYERDHNMAPEKARFILEALFSRLRRTLNRLRPDAPTASGWSRYMETHSYSEAAFREKEKFVRDAFQEVRPTSVLDIGANTGHFSLLAAEQGAKVVAIDGDMTSLGELWTEARHRKADVLPLMVNIARPSPGTGWRNGEGFPFLQRAGGKFDVVLMLAVVHHLLVSERVPLNDIIDLAADLTTDRAIIEFVGPEDPMFHTIARGRDALFSGLTREAFEASARRRFVIMRSSSLPQSSRWLYLLARKKE